MWLAWPETIDIYLGQSLALLKTSRKDTVVLQHPATLPLERILAKLGNELVKKAKLRIVLSGALCPAVSFAVPQGIKDWHELMQIANASAAADMHADAAQICCEMDGLRPGVAAAVSTRLLEELRHWATQHSCRIASIRPLWALATRSPAARQASIQTLTIQEPDAITLLADDGQGKLSASTRVPPLSEAELAALVRRWQVGLGLAEDRLARIGFEAAPRTAMPQGPKPWAAHWYTP